jgi:threonine dehydratase
MSTAVTRVDVLSAAGRIGGAIRRTPLLRADRNLWFKLDYLQPSGSFKVRGASNRILAAAQAGVLTEAGVIAASGGNAGLAFAHVAHQIGVRAEVYVPANAPAAKVSKLMALGAHVVQTGSEYAEAYEAAREREQVSGAMFCHAYDQPDMVAGNGTLALELLTDLAAFDTVIVAVGGGGLMAGVATGLDGAARVVAVEPVAAPTLHAALAAGRPVPIEVGGVAADSLGARQVGDIAFDVARKFSVVSVLVPDEAIVAARQQLWDGYRIVVEHGAATAHAAVAGGYYRPDPDERVVVVLCGANTDVSTLA